MGKNPEFLTETSSFLNLVGTLCQGKKLTVKLLSENSMSTSNKAIVIEVYLEKTSVYCYCGSQIPEGNNLREERVILAHSLTEVSPLWWEGLAE